MLTEEMLRVTGGRLVSGDLKTDVRTEKISTDSRSIKKGGLFIALKGDNYDGKAFLGDAMKKGAVGAITGGGAFCAKFPKRVLIEVGDTVKALHQIAAHHRSKFSIPVVAVTGSNGKTTVKEMASAILSAKYEVLKNEGTKNNHIGVPMTLLKMNPIHRLCVLELGMNHEGEIRTLAEMVKPQAAVITNIGPSHLEHFSGLEGIFAAKSEIFEHMDSRGIAIVNGDDKYLSGINLSDRVVRFGLGSKNEYRATDIKVKRDGISFLLNGKKRFELGLIGTHNVYNALAAIAVGARFGVGIASMRRSLKNYRPVSMRLNIRNMNGVVVINDAYNSNPFSMKCALEALGRYPARSRWVVSGDMMELGNMSEEYHRALGKEIAGSGARGLFTIGSNSRLTFQEAISSGMDKAMTWHCSSHEEAAAILKTLVEKGDAVLVKGSRAMRMEKVIDKLKADS